MLGSALSLTATVQCSLILAPFSLGEGTWKVFTEEDTRETESQRVTPRTMTELRLVHVGHEEHRYYSGYDPVTRISDLWFTELQGWVAVSTSVIRREDTKTVLRLTLSHCSSKCQRALSHRISCPPPTIQKPHSSVPTWEPSSHQTKADKLCEP